MSTASVSELRQYDATSYEAVVPALARIYGQVYQEPPYCEGSDDVADFVGSLPRRAAQPDFHLVVIFAGDEAVGFAFGHQLPRNTKWWNGSLTPLPETITRETAGRTFAIIELAVLEPYRRRGFARALHQALRAGRTEERLTLLVRPEATPARTAYENWGYVRVGSIRPWPTAPVYDAMILDIGDDQATGGDRRL
jgi:ribosomal protein S18 acetylase RimI-like enzyme